jgi:putative transcriptional regulator
MKTSSLSRGISVPIVVNLDVMLSKRKISGKELATGIGITEQNLSLLRTGKVKGVRFATLEKICQILECQPGDILEFVLDD